MTHRLHRPREPARLVFLVALLGLFRAAELWAQPPTAAQSPGQAPTAIEKRLRQLERRQADLLEQNRRLSARLGELLDRSGRESPAFFDSDEPFPAGGATATGPKSVFDMTGPGDPDGESAAPGIL